MSTRTTLTMSTLCFVLLGCSAEIPCEKSAAEKAAQAFEQCVQLKREGGVSIGAACGMRAQTIFCGQVK